MITGRVLLPYDFICPFEGTITFYSDPSFTTELAPSIVLDVNGNYTLPSNIDYSDLDVYVVIKNGLGTIVYSNKFFFFSNAVGDQIDYLNLNFTIRDIVQEQCEGTQADTVCSFYVIKKPCSNEFYVYNTQASLYHIITYNYGDGITEIAGDNGSHIYRNFGQYVITQRVYRVDDSAIVYECCGNSYNPGDILFEPVVCTQIVQATIFAPNISFTYKSTDVCCTANNCVSINQEIIFTPAITANNKECCPEGEINPPCIEPDTVEIIPINPDLVSPSNPYGQESYVRGAFCSLGGVDDEVDTRLWTNCIKIRVNTPCCTEAIRISVVFLEQEDIKFVEAYESVSNLSIPEQGTLPIDYREFAPATSREFELCYTFCSRGSSLTTFDGIGSISFHIETCDQTFVQTVLINSEQPPVQPGSLCPYDPGIVSATQEYIPFYFSPFAPPYFINVSAEIVQSFPPVSIPIYSETGVDLTGVTNLTDYLTLIVGNINDPSNIYNNPQKFFATLLPGNKVQILFNKSILEDAGITCYDSLLSLSFSDGVINSVNPTVSLDCCAAYTEEGSGFNPPPREEPCTEDSSLYHIIYSTGNLLVPNETKQLKLYIVTYSDDPAHQNQYGSFAIPKEIYSENLTFSYLDTVSSITVKLKGFFDNFKVSSANANNLYVDDVVSTPNSVELHKNGNGIGAPTSAGALELCEKRVKLRIAVDSPTNYEGVNLVIDISKQYKDY